MNESDFLFSFFFRSVIRATNCRVAHSELERMSSSNGTHSLGKAANKFNSRAAGLFPIGKCRRVYIVKVHDE